MKPVWGVDGAQVDTSASNPLPVTSTVSSIPAADRTTDSIAVALQTGAIMSGNTVLVPAFQASQPSTTAATTAVTAVTAKKIRVISAVVVATGATTVNFQSHTTTATATALFPVAANGGFVLPFNPAGWFETVAGEALDVKLGTGTSTGVQVTYVAV